MAVPKKRTSKAKKNQRKFNWKKKALKQSVKCVALGELGAVIKAERGD